MWRLWIGLLAATVACAQPPTKGIELTAERLARAQTVEADLYAKDSYRAAETALAEARQLVTEGDYRAAVVAASLASTRADEAYARARLGKQRMMRLARRQLLEIGFLLEESRYRGVPDAEIETLETLNDRLALLREELEHGTVAAVYENGTLLKSDALDFLNSLEPRGGSDR